MGTNYYLHKNICDCCGRGDGPMHIGKSSGGWCFGLHVGEQYSESEGDTVCIDSLDDWQEMWSRPGAVIRDEYGEPVTPEDMLRIITERSWPVKPGRQWGPGYTSWEDFHRQNHSQEGPNGLSRNKIDGRHCIGYGDGTYDLLAGEFS